MNDIPSYDRYSRQIALKEFGEAGQQRLQNAKVLVIGAGGLGCGALPYLAAAGVGQIGIVDDDTVALSNLQRQTLYKVADIGQPKAVAAASVLKALNPHIHIKSFNDRLTVTNAIVLLDNYDIVIDGTDNFASRYLINDACVLAGKPLVYGAVSRFEGQVAVFNVTENEQQSANYRDLFPQPPADGEVSNCAIAGVLGVLPGMIGCMQAGEVIKLITGIGEPLINKLFTFDALTNTSFVLELEASGSTAALIPADIPAFENTDYDWLCGVSPAMDELDMNAFNQLIADKSALIVDVREAGEIPLIDQFEHIKIPLGSLASSFPETSKQTIVLFCQSGARSRQAVKILSSKFGNTKSILSLAGGIRQWKTGEE